MVEIGLQGDWNYGKYGSLIEKKKKVITSFLQHLQSLTHYSQRIENKIFWSIVRLFLIQIEFRTETNCTSITVHRRTFLVFMLLKPIVLDLNPQ